MFKKTFYALILATTVGVAVVAADFPKPTGPVNDFAGLLDASTKASLKTLIDAVEQETTAEIAVATVTTLDGMSVEEYASKLFKEWGIGQKGSNNGVFLLVAPTERNMRIEVGYGLEGILPDGLTGSIMREDVVPHFGRGDYQAGIVRGVERIATIIRRNEPAVQNAGNQKSGFRPEWLLVLIAGVWVGVAMFEAGVALRARAFGPIVKGVVMAGPVLWFAPTFVAKSLFLLAPIAAVMIAVGFVLARRRSAWINAARGRNHGRGRWIWGTLDATPGRGGRSGSRGSSSGGSSSGSSFGGGSSGGGGASSKW